MRCAPDGYEATTVEAICAAAEISRSTFFRYFTSKDDAVLTDVDEASELLRDALSARPDEEPVWTALRHALEPLIDRYDADPQPGRQLAALIAETPGLAAHQHEKHVRWCEALRPEVSRRIGADPTDNTDPRSTATIAAALACLDAAVSVWATTEETPPIASILKRAMDATRL
ncbi:TetR family transcriptional regulator [Brachybacterium sp. FME24]|uniref:acyl-CoA-like ligand-binding transcription factor n=1 Tax=Brachybacterium sp. FME24 TaxID=2742605 RepID=UPI001868C84C